MKHAQSPRAAGPCVRPGSNKRTRTEGRKSLEDVSDGFLDVLGAILADNLSLHMVEGPNGPFFTIRRTPTVIACGDSMSACRWEVMTPRERALRVAKDIRKAAQPPITG